MLKVLEALIVILLLRLTSAAAPKEILFLINSQDTSYHRQLGNSLRNDIISQSQAISISSGHVVNVRLVHEIFNHPGDWSILPILPHLTTGGKSTLVSLVNANTEWVVWCEESTHIALGPLLQQLAEENHTEALYLGYPLYDQEATIIHHFAFFENPKWFPYPLLRSGVVFTAALLKRMAALIADDTMPWPGQRTEFTIDVAHELARFIFDSIAVESGAQRSQHAAADGDVGGGVVGFARAKGHKIINGGSSGGQAAANKNEQVLLKARNVIFKRAPYICPAAVAAHKGAAACFMYAKPMDAATCAPINREQIYFAIKTCQQYHGERVPIIEATWAAYTKNRKYYSDVAGTNQPDIINVGVPNTEVGHCAKTLAILKLALKDIEHIQQQQQLKQDTIRWIFLTDDDTLLSVSRLCEALGCYNSSSEIYLGERYGYRLHALDGFNYITGGGGIAFSLPTVRTILQHCTCPSASAPDDMILGSCLQALQVKAIHSAQFHQARPNDYSAELLQLTPPVSFHKFWQLDPLAVYKQWFSKSDRQMLDAEMSHNQQEPCKIQCNNNNGSQRSANFKERKYKKEQSKNFNSLGSMETVGKTTRFSTLPNRYHTKDKHWEL